MQPTKGLMSVLREKARASKGCCASSARQTQPAPCSRACPIGGDITEHRRHNITVYSRALYAVLCLFFDLSQDRASPIATGLSDSLIDRSPNRAHSSTRVALGLRVRGTQDLRFELPWRLNLARSSSEVPPHEGSWPEFCGRLTRRPLPRGLRGGVGSRSSQQTSDVSR